MSYRPLARFTRLLREPTTRHSSRCSPPPTFTSPEPADWHDNNIDGQKFRQRQSGQGVAARGGSALSVPVKTFINISQYPRVPMRHVRYGGKPIRAHLCRATAADTQGPFLYRENGWMYRMAYKAYDDDRLSRETVRSSSTPASSRPTTSSPRSATTPRIFSHAAPHNVSLLWRVAARGGEEVARAPGRASGCFGSRECRHSSPASAPCGSRKRRV